MAATHAATASARQPAHTIAGCGALALASSDGAGLFFCFAAD
jgi:hypothetical protein